MVLDFGEVYRNLRFVGVAPPEAFRVLRSWTICITQRRRAVTGWWPIGRDRIVGSTMLQLVAGRRRKPMGWPRVTGTGMSDGRIFLMMFLPAVASLFPS